MIPTARAHISRIQQTADKLAVDLPLAVVSTLSAGRRLVEQTERIEGHTAALNARVVDVLLNGGDPTDDAEVRKLVLLRVIGSSGIREAGRQRATELIAQAITEHADMIIDLFKAAVQTDCDTLTSATALADVPDLRQADVLALKNTGRLPIWSSAVNAYERVDTAAAAMWSIFAALNVRHERQHRPLAFTSDVDAVTAINSATSGTAPVDTWSVASVGVALQLANVTQFVERITDVDAEMQRRRRDEEAARQPDGFDGKRRQPATI